MKAPEVLIVEDEKLLRLMIAKLLQVSGYRVFTCGDSLKALELVEKKSFDLVITDLMMADAKGMDVLRATRKCQPRAKVIIITGTPSSQTLLEAKREGAYAYLRKPLQLSIQKTLGTKRKTDKLVLIYLFFYLVATGRLLLQDFIT